MGPIPAAARARRAGLLLAAGLAGAAPAAAQADALDRAPSRFAMFEGARVHFKSLGTGRTAVVLVHCWACDLTVWRHQVDVLAGRTRVVLVDLPGHGRSGRPETAYSMDHLARAVDTVLGIAGVDRAVLVGHSMGVPVIRELYRRNPGRVIGLVAVDGALRGPDTAAARQMIARFEGPGYREALERMVTGMYGEPGQAALRQTILAMALATPQHVLAGAMRGMVDPAIWRDDPIAVPLLVVVARGPNWPPAYRAYVQRLAPGVRYEELDGVGHFLMLERPEVFNPILVRFLASLQVMR
jgi:sigma-B regulation protein RsbQ